MVYMVENPKPDISYINTLIRVMTISEELINIIDINGKKINILDIPLDKILKLRYISFLRI